MKIIIKEATIEDALLISELHAASWRKAYRGLIPQAFLDELQDDFWLSSFQNWLGENKVKVKIIYENNIPAGCIAYGKSRDEQLPEWAEIVSIYLHPDYFRKGYGQELLAAALGDLKSVGYSNCYLWVLRENTNAIGFYEKNGFHCNQDEYKMEIMGEELTDLRFVIDL